MAKEFLSYHTEPEILGKVAAIAAPWRGREDMLIEVLRQVQEISGNYLPADVAAVVAKEMDIAKSTVFGVISFYAFFSTEKRGKNIIRICKSAPCHIKGAPEAIKNLEEALGIPVGGTTSDGKFTLEFCECLGICDKAPAVMINDLVFGPINRNNIGEILAKF